MRAAALLALVGALAPAACGSKDEAAGAVMFRARTSQLVEDDGMSSDGWTLHFDRFLVAFRDLSMRNGDGAPTVSLLGSRIVDLKVKGTKELVAFSDVPAGSYDRIAYAVGPVASDHDVGVGATLADRTLMVDGGHGLYFEGHATRDGVTKYFLWGFDLDTHYDHCRIRGSVGTTIDDGAVADVSFVLDTTRIFAGGFARIAAADANGDAIVTLDELAAVGLLAGVKDAVRGLPQDCDVTP